MKFKLDTAKRFYSMEGEENEDKQKLEKLGLKFREYKSTWNGTVEWYLEEEGSIEINSLEDLIKLNKEWGDVVFSEDEITIYNDYLE